MARQDEGTGPVVPMFAPDRSSPVPLYFQVATHLENAISSGVIPPGTLFENEIQLAEDMGLSRPTMRRAMQTLVDKGLIVRRRGIGTRVVQPKVRRPLELTSLYDDLTHSGATPRPRCCPSDISRPILKWPRRCSLPKATRSSGSNDCGPRAETRSPR